MANSNTETRILEMQLENKDFEDGIRKTIQSLESLEEKLNLKNAGDGFEKVSAAANSIQMSHLESGLDEVTNKFTLMGQVGLQVLERISNKVVNLGESIIKAATIQPVMDGWSEFEMKTDSVQTILGGIRNQAEFAGDQPKAIRAISESLDELNEYADKTIYNFAQMTENVGKFTNQGISLDASTNAIKGIANWAAAVGANPQQMSRAMYNISQSLGSGSMQLIDWRSIRFANMATPEVKELFAQVAMSMGELAEDGMVKVSKKEKVSVFDDFEKTLKTGWLTNDVMAEAFSIYANAYSEEELVEKYGEELGKKFYEMGVYAEEAATKVRTFTQLIGVLKEGLGSGWASTFDILFGGFEQQTEFLTNIKNKLEEIINYQTDDRNNWLKNFANVGGVKALQETILKTIDIFTDFYWVVNDVVALILNPFGSNSEGALENSVFSPKQNGYDNLVKPWELVASAFEKISGYLDKFREWMHTPDSETGRSPLLNLGNALSGVAGAAGIAWQVITKFGRFVFRLFKRFSPLVSAVLDLTGQIGATIYNLFYNLTGQGTIETFFDNLEKWVGPAVDLVVNFATAVVKLIHNLLGIDAAADDWTVLGERMQAFWDIFKYDDNLDFAENLKNGFKKALVAIFGKDTADAILAAYHEHIEPVIGQIGESFTKAFGDLQRIIDGLTAAAGADYSKADGVEGGALIFLDAFLKGVYGDDTKSAEEAFNNILGIYSQIEKYYEDNVSPHVQTLTNIFTKTLPELNATILNFLFGHEVTGKQGNTWREGGLLQEVQNYFTSDDWNKTLESITRTIDKVINAISDAYSKVDEFLFGRKTTVITGGGNSFTRRDGGLIPGIKGYFESETWEENWAIIKGAFEEISGWIESTGNAAWKTIMDFLFGEETTDEKGSTTRVGGAYDEARRFFDPVIDWVQTKVEFLYNWLKTHNIQEMWDSLNGLLFGYDDVVADRNGPNLTSHYEHVDGVLQPILDVLRPIADVFEQVKGWALEKLGDIDWGSIWSSIGRFFGGYEETVVDNQTGRINTVWHEGMFDKISGFFERIIDWFNSPEVQEFLAKAKLFYDTSIKPSLEWLGGLGGEIWTSIQGLFDGQGLGAFDNVGTYISDGFNSLTEKLFPGGFDLGGLGGLFGGLFGGGGDKKTQDAAKDAEKEAQSGGGFLDWFVGAISGTADAAEADGADIANTSQAIVAVLDDTQQAVDGAEKKTTGVLDVVSKFLPYIAGAGAIGLVGKVSDMITGITGNRKPTIIEQITGLIGTLGGLFEGLAWAIGAAALAEKISPDAIDKVFGHIESLLTTIFGWMLGLGLGGTVASGGVGLLTTFFGGKIAEKFEGMDPNKVHINIDSMSSILASIGSGFSGLFGGLQTLFNLAWEVAGSDWLMGYDDDKQKYRFDEAIDRVCGFIGTVLTSLFTNLGSLELFGANIATGAAEGTIEHFSKTESKANSIAELLGGLGSFVGNVLDGVSALMTATIVPELLNVDVEKYTAVIKAVFDSLGTFIGVITAYNFTTFLFKIQKVNWPAIGALAVTDGLLVTALGAIGLLAGALVDWYMSIAEKHMWSMAPAIEAFMTSLAHALEAINSIGDITIDDAITILKEKLPELFKAITGQGSGDYDGYNKGIIEDRGKVIRDFGTRVKSGVESLAAAKEVFDKYNTGNTGEGFPLVFFRDMTEALRYLTEDGEIEKLYEQAFGTVLNLAPENGKDEESINALSSFFSTLGSLGYVITEYEKSSGLGGLIKEKGQAFNSTEDGLEAFQDSFSGIQTTLHNLIIDISDEKFDSKKIEAIADLLKKIGDAGKVFAESFASTNTVSGWKVYEITSPIMQFSYWLQTMGTGIRNLNNSLKNNDGEYDIDYTQIMKALKALRPMADLEKKLHEYNSLGQGNNYLWTTLLDDWLSNVTPKMGEIGEKLHDLASAVKPEDQSVLTSIGGIMSGMATMFDGSNGLTTEGIDSYTTALNDLKQAFLFSPEEQGNTVYGMLQALQEITSGDGTVKLTITPVIDDTSSGATLLGGLLNGGSTSQTITLSIDPSCVVKVDNQSEIDELRAANTTLANILLSITTGAASNASAISGLGENIDGVATEISRMKIYLDTGVLVGAVDEGLGWRMLMAGRTGTPGKIP